jgi:GTP cyclohydrolase I
MIGIVTVGEDGKKLPLPGLSKYDRLFGFHARRGHVQENLGHDVLQKLQEETKAHKIAVYINCSHSCVTHRGVGGARNRTATLHMTGAFQQDSALRSEFAGACHYQLGRLQA